MDNQLEELFIAAAESDQDQAPFSLLKELEKIDTLQTDEFKAQLDFLLESWEQNVTPSRAGFLINLAGMNPPDSATYRGLLTEGVKKILPPYLNRAGFLRALGLRDTNQLLPLVAKRCRGLLQLKNGVFFYYADAKLWGTVSSIDEFTGSIGVTAINNSNTHSIPLEKLLDHAKFFTPGPSVRKLVPLVKPMRINAVEYRDIATKNVLNGITEDELKLIARETLTPEFVPADQFDGWWKCEAKCVVAGMGRSPSDARSIQELHLLLQKLNDASDHRMNDEDAAKLTALFTRVSCPANRKDLLLLLEAVAMLAGYFSSEQLGRVLTPLKGKVPFWPVALDDLTLEELDVWGEIGVRFIPAVITACKSIYDEDYLAEYAIHLPLRCLNQFCENIDDDLLTDSILGARSCSSDILLWIWKNRKTHSEHLVSMVNLKNVINALSLRDLPKAWGSAQRELRLQLIDKKDFQVHLIECAGDDLASIIYALQGARFFQPGEQQSLLVKLSRVSEKLRTLLESGEGRRLMGSGRPGEASQVPSGPQPIISSVRSHRRLIEELDEIIKVHTPENREAIKVARAHGDFRENAEYDAAKERRNFLSRRRSELERDISQIQSSDFRDVEVKDRVVIGSAVDLVDQKGKRDTYYILGAWDGAPEKNWISYKTRLGEIILGKKVGESVTMPDDRSVTVEKIAPLPNEMITWLAGDEA